MQTDVLVDTIDTHTAGEPTRILTSGFDRTWDRGLSVAKKRDRFAEDQDHLRRLLMCEPRGHDDMFGAVTVEPLAAEADLGLFFMDGDGYLDMCGHGTMGVVTALIETGQLSPMSTVTFETPAGLVRAKPTVENGRVESVTVRNVTSYVYDSFTVPLEVDGESRSIPVDVVVAGNAFALVDADAVGLEIRPSNAATFVDLGLELRSRINARHEIVDPFTGESRSVDIAEFYDHRTEADRNVVVFGDGQIDRSPCGTGTCAKMTLLHEERKLEIEEPYPYESIIGTRFTGRLVDVEDRDGIAVTTPEVTGSASITGLHTFVRDQTDDLEGFSLTGTKNE